VPKADFTYELRHLPEEAAGIEDYVVRGADGEALGTVAGLLERDGERLLAVESGAPPLAHERRVVSWDDVDDVDHEALAVWLRLDEDAYARALELDPDAARDPSEGADARRVTDLPPDLAPRPAVAPGGPVDRSLVYVAIGLAAAMAFSVLVLVAIATRIQSEWLLAGIVVPAVLAAASLAVAFRAWREPYGTRGERKT
jgi:hypothetical protein